MMQSKILLGLLAGSAVLTHSPNLFARDIKINEAVVDPHYDWNGDGSITPSDEWFELYNPRDTPFNLFGIELHLVDTTPEGLSLTNYGQIEPRSYLVISNPEGMQNNDGRLELYDVIRGEYIDGFSYGDWSGNDFGIPDGNAHGMYDESLSRFRDGENNFAKTYATQGQQNIPAPASGLVGLLGLGALRRRR